MITMLWPTVNLKLAILWVLKRLISSLSFDNSYIIHLLRSSHAIPQDYNNQKRSTFAEVILNKPDQLHQLWVPNSSSVVLLGLGNFGCSNTFHLPTFITLSHRTGWSLKKIFASSANGNTDGSNSNAVSYSSIHNQVVVSCNFNQPNIQWTLF